MKKNLQGEVREPQQRRSKIRIDQILDAAQRIIVEKGFANLTMTEIALVADVTGASIYQYFRNRNEVVIALAQRYGLLIHEMFQEIYRELPKNLHEHAQKLLQVLRGYHQIHVDNPSIRDVWAGAATDKAMQALTREETANNMQFHMKLAGRFFPPETHPEVFRTLMLLMQYGITSALTALEFEGDQRVAMLNTAERMIMDAWWPFVTANAYPEFINLDQ